MFELVSVEIAAVKRFLAQKKIKPENIFRVSNDLDMLKSASNECRTVWFNHLTRTEQRAKLNSRTLSAGFHPDFNIVSLIQLESIVRNSGRVDGQHFERNGGLSAASRASAPSQTRKTYGLLFDLLNDKFLSKPII